MPRYHFDLVDHNTVEDNGGQVLSGDTAATGVADELLRANIIGYVPNCVTRDISSSSRIKKAARFTAQRFDRPAGVNPPR
jgi:hypothetical protein